MNKGLKTALKILVGLFVVCVVLMVVDSYISQQQALSWQERRETLRTFAVEHRASAEKVRSQLEPGQWLALGTIPPGTRYTHPRTVFLQRYHDHALFVDVPDVYHDYEKVLASVAAGNSPDYEEPLGEYDFVNGIFFRSWSELYAKDSDSVPQVTQSFERLTKFGSLLVLSRPYPVHPVYSV